MKMNIVSHGGYMKTIEDKLQSLPAEIKTALNAVAKKLETAGASNGVWTKTIKKALMKVGNDHGYVVCTSGVPKADWGEWLYDMCWLKHKKDKVYDIPALLLFKGDISIAIKIY